LTAFGWLPKVPLEINLIGAVDPLYPRRTIPEWRIDAGLPEIRRFEHVQVRWRITGGIGISIPT
jgi:hypothetical protein